MAVDVSGNIYVAGRYGGPAAFGSFTLTNLSAGFTMKLDPATTNVIWAKSDGAEWLGVAADAGGNSHVIGEAATFQLAGSKLASPITGRAIAVAADGSVYETGEYASVFPVDFDGTTLASKSTATSMFVAKLAAPSAPAPSVQSLTLLGGGVIQLTVSGTAGQSYVIEVSGTPGNFIAIATNNLSGGILQFNDPGWSGANSRFYRLRLP